MDKTCTKCKVSKPLTAFNKDAPRKDGLSYWCKACSNANAKKFYGENQERLRLAARRRREEGVAVANAYLREHPCVDCGESDIQVLQFDHIERVRGRGHRVFDYARDVTRMLEEINKCEVRCANCHLRRTRQQLGWVRADG